jgi:hypothetical protein
MNKVKISQLSFCEVATGEEIDIKGGSKLTKEVSNPVALSILQKFFPDVSLDFLSQEVESLSLENAVVEPIEDQANGVSGFTITSKDGKTKAGFLSGSSISLTSVSRSESY